jgi:hypothetical protein
VPELDRLKEQLAYLKFWQGIMAVTDIGLVTGGLFRRLMAHALSPLC